MFRAPGLFAALALCALLIGGGAGLHAALTGAYARGQAHGQALALAQANARLAEWQAAVDHAREAAGRDVAALESEKDALREMLHELEKQAALAEPAWGAVEGAPGPSPCLDAGRVRALDAIRRPAAGPRGP
jgi:hypothetical protein